MNSLARFFVCLVGGATLFCNLAIVQAAQSLDRVVLTVNGSPITARAIEEEKQLHSKKDPVSQKELLENLITEELFLGLAQKSGADLDSREVNQQLEYMIQSKNVPPELAKNKQKLKRKMIAGSIIDSMYMQMKTMVDKSNLVSDEEIEEQVKELTGQLQASPVRFHLETLIIPSRHSKTQSKSLFRFFNLCALWKRFKKTKIPSPALVSFTSLDREIAEQTLLKAKEGIPFKVLAKEKSRKPAWKVEEISRTIDQLPEAYNNALKSLSPQEVAGPFELDNGLHLIRLKEVTGPKMFQARHILLKERFDTDSDKIKQKLKAIRERCLADSKAFALQAEQHSEDSDTLFKGGDLGWVIPETLKKPFDKVLEALKPGEISLPFKTTDGWHIVQILNKQFLTFEHPEWKRHMAKERAKEKKALEMIEEQKVELYHSAHIEWIDPSFQKMI